MGIAETGDTTKTMKTRRDLELVPILPENFPIRKYGRCSFEYRIDL